MEASAGQHHRLDEEPHSEVPLLFPLLEPSVGLRVLSVVIVTAEVGGYVVMVVVVVVVVASSKMVAVVVLLLIVVVKSPFSSHCA